MGGKSIAVRRRNDCIGLRASEVGSLYGPALPVMTSAVDETPVIFRTLMPIFKRRSRSRSNCRREAN